MKNIAKGILSLMIVVLYVVSTMGYGVHECKNEGTADVILLFGETPCEYVHSHVDKNGNVYTHAHNPAEHNISCTCGSSHSNDICVENHANHNTNSEVSEHDGNCCSTNVFVLTHDQTISGNVYLSDVPCFILPFAVEHLCEINNLGRTIANGSRCFDSLKIPLIEDPQVVNCVFRV